MLEWRSTRLVVPCVETIKSWRWNCKDIPSYCTTDAHGRGSGSGGSDNAGSVGRSSVLLGAFLLTVGSLTVKATLVKQMLGVWWYSRC